MTVAEPFPRVWVTRRLVDDGSRYFGPYTDVGAMRRALNVVKRIFTVRSCNYDMPKQMPERPCLDYYIKRCKAPCILAQTQGEYRAMIDEVLLFLDGRTRRGRCAACASEWSWRRESLDFERAGELRDALAAPRAAWKSRRSCCRGRRRRSRRARLRARRRRRRRRAACAFAAGKLLAREHQFLENLEEETDGAVLEAYLAATYLPLEDRAAELLVPVRPDDRELRRGVARATRRCTRRSAVRAASWSISPTQNARHLLEELRLTGDETDERAGDPMYELQRELGLQKVPRSLVCFDISHAQGTDTVASCVWFQNGRPYRAEYRKFKVKTVEGIDDFASMHEVGDALLHADASRTRSRCRISCSSTAARDSSTRRTRRSTRSGSARCRSSASRSARRRSSWSAGSESLRLPRRSPALRVLQQARDEAHRFAITFQRKRRSMRTVTSELLRIPGVGEAKRRAVAARPSAVCRACATPPSRRSRRSRLRRRRRQSASSASLRDNSPTAAAPRDQRDADRGTQRRI